MKSKNSERVTVVTKTFRQLKAEFPSDSTGGILESYLQAQLDAGLDVRSVVRSSSGDLMFVFRSADGK